MKRTFMPKKFRPAPSGAELDETHQTQHAMHISSCLFVKDKTVASICIGPKNDMVIQTIEKQTITEEQVIILYIEEMYQSWSLFCRNGSIYFIIKDASNKNIVVTPSRLYFRSGCCDSDSYFADNLFSLINMLDLWQGDILCRPMEHRLNNSKLLQTSVTIIPVAKKFHQRCDVPRSYVVKGIDNLNNIDLNNVVIKSLSGIRSDVVDSKTFMRWNKSSINDLPILLQQKISGQDIRVHSINDELFAKKIVRKNTTASYRYHTKDDEMKKYFVSSELENICNNLIALEGLNLSGIDFMLGNDGKYYCFEVNPGPGWSAYHAIEDIRTHCFLSKIMDYLNHAKV